MSHFNIIELKMPKILLLLVFVILSLLFSSCGNSAYEEKRISEVINTEYNTTVALNNIINPEETESITITTLPSPPKIKIIDKKEDIKEIITFINSIKLEETKHDNIKGWVILIATKGKNNHSLSFLGSLIHIDGKWYTTNKDELSKLRTLYNDLDYKEIPFKDYNDGMYEIITE
ncbi:hypothetical protein LGK97_15065 [Clostridium sp. CS001]|uniref:hypothetical protein n=1 Tax=Clostridium sp. CS001 TaxID=2880648 RepID=UPI001CF4CECA|nr:hypothetical protein [Clostridium sp. CS001]MCB2291055.1 hypothetical protein [Clostridium sp. CS001]